MPAPSSCLRNASTASIVGSTTALLLSDIPQIPLRMTRWSSRSTTLRWSFVHHGRGPYFDRYAYRITNAFDKPRAKSLGHSTSEARDSEIRQQANVDRVIRGLQGCTVVVLCGQKAQLLADRLGSCGKTVIPVCHTGNQGLNSTYAASEIQTSTSSHARREARVERWAKDVLRMLEARSAGGGTSRPGTGEPRRGRCRRSVEPNSLSPCCPEVGPP
jgi:hypothetical protein